MTQVNNAMKPADSGQIAKVREFWNEWVNGPDGGESLFLTSSNPSRTVFKFAAAFAASKRQAVIEECCRKLCVYCNNANSWNPATNGKHAYKFGPDERFCDARAIRSMGE